MYRRTTNYKIITRALELLKSGLPADNLPNQLRDEFGLRPGQTKELVDEAIELYKKRGRRGKLDTKPFNKSD